MKQDQLILAWIFNSLSPQILAQVVNCKTSSQLWHRLNQIYNSQSVAKILGYQLKLQIIRKGGDTCAEYLQKIQSIVDKLRSIITPVPNQDLLLYTLQGLGSEFGNFVTAISLQPSLITESELHSLLLAHEARIQTNLLTSSPSPVVNLTVTDNTSQAPTQALLHNTLIVIPKIKVRMCIEAEGVVVSQVEHEKTSYVKSAQNGFTQH